MAKVYRVEFNKNGTIESVTPTRRPFKEKVRDGVRVATDWVKENGPAIVETLGVVTVVGGTAASLLRAVNNSRIGARNVKVAKDRMIYDRSAMHYWTLKRNPTNEEWATVEARRKAGEKLGDILREMKLLK